jgi:hypothetical protein
MNNIIHQNVVTGQEVTAAEADRVATERGRRTKEEVLIVTEEDLVLARIGVAVEEQKIREVDMEQRQMQVGRRREEQAPRGRILHRTSQQLGVRTAMPRTDTVITATLTGHLQKMLQVKSLPHMGEVAKRSEVLPTRLRVRPEQGTDMPEKVAALPALTVPGVQETPDITLQLGQQVIEVTLAEIMKVQAMVAQVLLSPSRLKPQIFLTTLAQDIVIHSCQVLKELVCCLRVSIIEHDSRIITRRHKIIRMALIM